MATMDRSFAYPAARRQDDVVDTYPGGHAVTDHYRWLEDPDSEETKAWVQSQVEITDKHLHGLEHREKLKAKVG